MEIKDRKNKIKQLRKQRAELHNKRSLLGYEVMRENCEMIHEIWEEIKREDKND